MSVAIKTTGVMAEPTLILLVAGRAPQFSPNSRVINPGVCRGLSVQLCPCLPALCPLTACDTAEHSSGQVPCFLLLSPTLGSRISIVGTLQ